ncbi:hypothetical protein [Aliiroseovarius sp. 2305UL8-7]|uniref:hypothetical protein n=1 Tax=Aliiroseovarius conchicola TaxID=3121637 RepID=UPI00352780EA
MSKKRNVAALSTAAFLTVCVISGGAAKAQLAPVADPNGSFSGNIDGHTIALPVLCTRYADILDISSHNQVISNNTTTGGVEPALNIKAFETGFQIVVFVAGERYKIMRARDTLETFPFSLAREVKASGIGKIEVDFEITCPEL